MSLADWARSGAMALTGYRTGAPMVAPGDPAGQVRRQLADLGVLRPGLLGERAAHTGHLRNAPRSTGDAFRMMPTLDGWIGLSLARESDRDLVPALVEGEVARDPDHDPWPAVARWASQCSSREAGERLALLSLPGGQVGEELAPRSAVEVSPSGGQRPASEHPLVVDLTSLWAGPLAAHLLRGTGARVVKVESRDRPDGARRGSQDFFEALNRGSEFLSLDLHRDRAQLLDLMHRADLVLEASRPRALRRLGYLAEELVAGGTRWLSVTAHGRASDRVGFGDDVAATAGLVVWHPGTGEPVPVGDAIADPMTGVAAARAAVAALTEDRARLIDVSMAHVVSESVGPIAEHTVLRRADQWWLDDGTRLTEVLAPYRWQP